MPREDVEFKTNDQVTLRGWFYTPASAEAGAKLPCIVMAHGFSAVKHMDMPTFAEAFTSTYAMNVLVYDHRGFGTSDVGVGQPRQEIVPMTQISDYQDAISYVQLRPEVDPEKVGVWGSSYSAGHVLYLASFDKRVKAVIAQVPFTNGPETMSRLVRPDFAVGLRAQFQADRLARASGHPAAMLPVVDANPMAPSALPTPDSYTFLSEWVKKDVGYLNEVTVRSVELLKGYKPDVAMELISPIPLLMVVAQNDWLTPYDLALQAYNRALEPKELLLLNGGHFDAYSGEPLKINLKRQLEFLGRTLCA